LDFLKAKFVFKNGFFALLKSPNYDHAQYNLLDIVLTISWMPFYRRLKNGVSRSARLHIALPANQSLHPKTAGEEGC
jgi:hypothetical protein